MIEAALKHAMNFFQIHAEQRMKLINFYIILLAGSLALIGASFKDGNYKIQILTGISTCVITFIFKSLDVRTAFFVKKAEVAIDAIEKKLSDELGTEEIRIIKSSNEGSSIFSYRKSFNILFLLGIAIGLISIANGADTFMARP